VLLIIFRFYYQLISRNYTVRRSCQTRTFKVSSHTFAKFFIFWTDDGDRSSRLRDGERRWTWKAN